MSKRAAAYFRVSTNKQERDGTSLETQEEACREYAKAHDYELVATFRETFSGGTLERPALSELREMLRRGELDVLVVYCIDRLSRDEFEVLLLAHEVREYGCELAFVTQTIDDGPLRNVMLALFGYAAEDERRRILERFTRGKLKVARDGRMPQGTGVGTYGYVLVPGAGKRVVNEAQAEVVRRIFDDFLATHSVNGVSTRLNRDGVMAFKGGRWHPRTVSNVLRNVAYTGVTYYGRTQRTKARSTRTGKLTRQLAQRDRAEWIKIEDATPAIVSTQDFERAQSVLADPERRARLDHASVYALRGRIRCAECGSAMNGRSSISVRYRYYECSRKARLGKEACPSSRSIPAAKLEATVLEAIADALAHPRRVLAELRRESGGKASASKVASLRKQLDDLRAQRSRLLDLYVDGAITKLEFDKRDSNLDARATRIDAEVTSLAGTGEVLDLSAIERNLPAAARAIRAWVLGADADSLDLVLRALDVTVRASRTNVTVEGSIPVLEPGIEGEQELRAPFKK